MSTDEDRTERHAFAEELGLYMESKGLPRIPGRVLGWLLVCEPEHQSAEELAEALTTSRGSISMATQYLQRAGVVERYPVPGSRRIYYRIRPGFWLNEASEKAKVAEEAVKLAERGLSTMADSSEDSRARLRDMRDMYSFLATEYARIENKWRQMQKE
ncbi:GbsR/MarR family transcriptional regulator [Stackebrandtia nassauensis]|uniref:Regulatory protein, MarR n=1 Tax=Stackebrandtia nassauensis (strain DSM 44728 / CIP 108903 / NRRL B-16338 / NBRC 102104 / LLR-40K-21) TaxID=446470 RepID=D3Q7I5_STANL|nr:MarR family transcriptional regulator [Stackebrandtia nassauensis]ADD44327.1 regulatory protein, MarR [Stackebrandtia nassauensis DSM 44728]